MAEILSIPEPDIRVVAFRIMGTAPLISHKWSDKNKTDIINKQQKAPSKGRPVRDPQAEYEASIYHCGDGGYGFPAIAFKLAMVRAAKQTGMAMTDARTAFHVLADSQDMVRIDGESSMRQDMVRIGRGVADIRFRAQFVEWGATINIRYNATTISAAQLANLLMIAGFSVGVGDWRPDRSGQFGTFCIKEDSE